MLKCKAAWPQERIAAQRESAKRGYTKLFEDCVLQADQGCDFNFLLREGITKLTSETYETVCAGDEALMACVTKETGLMKKLDHTASGVYAIAVTPFTPDAQSTQLCRSHDGFLSILRCFRPDILVRWAKRRSLMRLRHGYFQPGCPPGQCASGCRRCPRQALRPCGLWPTE